MKILCVGPIWRGSNAGALFMALSRLGHIIECIDEFNYIPLRSNTKFSKIWSKIGRSFYVKSFNNGILKRSSLLQPDVVLVYKGAFVLPETITSLKRNATVVNFYPDVSFHTHGNLLTKTLPLYDLVFTTKTFGVVDLATQLNQQNAKFIAHGFDPSIHRPINQLDEGIDKFACEVSFIGTWSKHKEDYLSYIVKEIPSIQLKIWGDQWEHADPMLNPHIQNQSVLGDLYALAIQASTVNIALLSEQVVGASSGDKITSRTFHIPASGGFMLHQDSDEIAQYYHVGTEIDVFDSKQDLVEKIKHYLAEPGEREQIRKAGYSRAVKDHSIDQRALKLLQYLDERNI